MSVALDAIASGIGNFNGNAQGVNCDSTFQTVGTGSNRALIVMLNFNDTAVSGVTVQWDVTGSPQSLTQITTASNGATNSRVDIWALVAPTSGNKTLRVAWSGGGTSDVSVFSLAYTGVDQTGGSTSFPNAATAAANSTTALVTITSAIGDAVVATYCTPNNGFSSPSQTEIYNNGGSVNFNSAGQRTAGAASVAMQYTVSPTSDPWVACGCDILASSFIPEPPYGGPALRIFQLAPPPRH